MRTLASALAVLFAVCNGSQAQQTQVLFAVTNGPPGDTFVIALTDPARIAQARAIVSDAERARVHVSGLIVKKPASYNSPWRFHLAPESIQFFEFAIEVCDAATSYVDAHLEEVGGAFLPRGRWCPWQSKVDREMK